MIKIIELNVSMRLVRKLSPSITITATHATVVPKAKPLMMMEFGIVIHAIMICVLSAPSDWWISVLNMFTLLKFLKLSFDSIYYLLPLIYIC